MEKFIIISLIAVMGWTSYMTYTEVSQDKTQRNFKSTNNPVFKPIRQHAHVSIENKSTQ